MPDLRPFVMRDDPVSEISAVQWTGDLADVPEWLRPEDGKPTDFLTNYWGAVFPLNATDWICHQGNTTHAHMFVVADSTFKQLYVEK